MKTMTVGDFKTNFSKVVEGIKKGDKYTVSYGKNKEKFAVIIPFKEYLPNKNRKLGILSKDGKITFAKGFKMSDEEFLNL